MLHLGVVLSFAHPATGHISLTTDLIDFIKRTKNIQLSNCLSIIYKENWQLLSFQLGQI